MGKDAATDLLDGATTGAANAHALCDDLAHLLFPKASEPPTEQMQAAVLLLLQKTVLGIERRLQVAAEEDSIPRSWDLLRQSGLLGEPDFIEFALARLAERNLMKRLNLSASRILEQLPVRLLEEQDPALREMALGLIDAQNRSVGGDPVSLADQLPVDLLHLLLWRVVAVFRFDKQLGDDLVRQARVVLAQHDETRTLRSAAAKLLYFLPEGLRVELNNPILSGLALFIADVEREFGIPFDRVLRFIDEEPVAPLLLLLKSRGIASNDVAATVLALRGQRGSDHQLPPLIEGYGRIAIDEAKRVVSIWRGNRVLQSKTS